MHITTGWQKNTYQTIIVYYIKSESYIWEEYGKAGTSVTTPQNEHDEAQRRCLVCQILLPMWIILYVLESCAGTGVSLDLRPNQGNHTVQ